MKAKWQPIVKINASLLFQWYWIKGSLEETSASLGLDFRYRNNKIVSGEISIDLHEAAEINALLHAKIQASPDYSYLKDYLDRCYRISDRLLDTSKCAGRGRLTALPSQKLVSRYLDYQKKVLKLMPFLNTILVLDEVLKKEIVQLLQSELDINNRQDQDILLSKLVIPKKKSYFVQETESLLAMALKLQADGATDINKDIRQHLTKFAWMSSISYLGSFQTENDIRKKVNQLVKENPEKKIKDQQLITQRSQQDFQQSWGEIAKSKKLRLLIDYAREFIFLQTYRLDVFFLAHYLVFPLLEEIGHRTDASVDDLVFLTGDELVDFLKNQKPVNRREVTHRKLNYALILEGGKWSLFSGSRVKTPKTAAKKETLVKGTVASRGRATGLVKKIFKLADLPKVRRGDILVSPMTRPEFTPAIIKSAGIITDFGGMLSHAAIISREFGIPCLVGTDRATQVFQDGDLVELNAYEGIARKL